MGSNLPCVNSSAEIPAYVLCIITGKDRLLEGLPEGDPVELWYSSELNRKILFLFINILQNLLKLQSFNFISFMD